MNEDEIRRLIDQRIKEDVGFRESIANATQAQKLSLVRDLISSVLGAQYLATLSPIMLAYIVYVIMTQNRLPGDATSKPPRPLPDENDD